MRQNRFCFNITSRPVDPTNYLFVRVLVLTGGGVSAESGIPTFRGKEGYWPRVWAARGLLHAWDDRATAVIVQATADGAWRVREMAAKVIARHRVGEAG